MVVVLLLVGRALVVTIRLRKEIYLRGMLLVLPFVVALASLC